jgi:hypothetical protein
MEKSDQTSSPGVALDIKLGKVYKDFSVDAEAVGRCLAARGMSPDDVARLTIVISSAMVHEYETYIPIGSIYTCGKKADESSRPAIFLFAGRVMNSIRTGKYDGRGHDRVFSDSKARAYSPEYRTPPKDHYPESPWYRRAIFRIIERCSERRLDAVLKNALALHILYNHREGVQDLVEAQERRERVTSYAAGIVLSVGRLLEGLGVKALIHSVGAAALGLSKPSASLLYRQVFDVRACHRARRALTTEPMVHMTYRTDYAEGALMMEYPDIVSYPTIGSTMVLDALRALPAPIDIESWRNEISVDAYYNRAMNNRKSTGQAGVT